MQPMKNIVFENAYQKNARTLLDKRLNARVIATRVYHAKYKVF